MRIASRPFLFVPLLLIAGLVNAQDEIVIDGQPCGMHGNAKENTKEYDQNPLKNRYNFPTEVTVLDFNELIDGSATRDKFSSAMAVELVGYVEKVSWGSKETCNCKTTTSLYTDTHMEITPSSSLTGPQYRISVEVTPRLRQMMDEQYGEDWTSPTLKRDYLHRMVRIQGWMFYDGSHESADFANDPQDERGEKNRRATSWEIHPVTYIESMDEEFASNEGGTGDDDDGIGTSGPVTHPASPTIIHPRNTTDMSTAERTPAEWLTIILLAMILGIVGQLMRAVVGLSKASGKVAAGDASAGFRPAELLFSLLIAMVVGAVAGVLAAVTAGDWQGGEMITAFIAAGYAGTDFIEGWMKKAGMGGAPTSPSSAVGAPAAGAVPPNAPPRPAPPAGSYDL